MDICSRLFIIGLPEIAKYWKQSNRGLSSYNGVLCSSNKGVRSPMYCWGWSSAYFKCKKQEAQYCVWYAMFHIKRGGVSFLVIFFLIKKFLSYIFKKRKLKANGNGYLHRRGKGQGDSIDMTTRLLQMYHIL